MKKRFIYSLTLGMLIIPLAFRIAFPELYFRTLSLHPIGGFVLVILLDLSWMWGLLLIMVPSTRLIRWTRRQLNKSDHQALSGEANLLQ